jgi:hypothetical protein
MGLLDEQSWVLAACMYVIALHISSSSVHMYVIALHISSSSVHMPSAPLKSAAMSGEGGHSLC